MMQYQKTNYNFIPKEKTEVQPEESKETLNIQEEAPNINIIENSTLKAEKEKLLLEIESLKKKLEDAETQLVRKDNEISSIIKEYNDYLAYEKNPEEFNELKTSIEEVQSMKNQMSALTEENEVLKNQVESYKTHIQYLYLILLILAIL